MTLRLALLALAWVGWCTLHSVLICPAVTRWVKLRLGPRFAYFRVGYNLISLTTLVPVVLFTHSLHTGPLFHWSWPYAGIKYALWGLGGLMFILGARCYDLSHFLGLKQILALRAKGPIPATDRLATSGILGITRHPWYGAGLLLLWARDLSPATLVTNGVLSAYLVIGAHLEERKLLLTFGEAYRDYQRRVSMFFPLKWLRQKWGNPYYRNRPAPEQELLWEIPLDKGVEKHILG